MAIGSFIVPMGSGGSSGPSISPYVRPTDWLTIPTPASQEAKEIFAPLNSDITIWIEIDEPIEE
jgi:hypothetical protein